MHAIVSILLSFFLLFTVCSAELVTFYLEITQEYRSFENFKRDVIAVNGTIPGPTLRVKEGSEVSVIVHNMLWRDTIAVHFHGQHFVGSPAMDGASGVSQCPILPGTKFEYRFTANVSGTYWYHSHATAQMIDGLYGLFIVDSLSDPFILDYDEEIIVVASDLFAENSVAAFSKWYFEMGVMFYNPISFLLNGLGTNNCSNNPVAGCSLDNATVVKPNSRYRIRILNACLERAFYFMIDNHTLEVINTDARAIKPIKNIDVISVDVGQRYDVIVHANQQPTSYWMRIFTSESKTIAPSVILSPFRYDTAPSVTPNTTQKSIAEANYLPRYHLSPIGGFPSALRSLYDDEVPKDYDVEYYIKFTSADGRYLVNGKSFDMHSINPPLIWRVFNNEPLPDHVGEFITLPYNKVIQLVIESTVMMGHPLHMHGHHMYVMGGGLGSWDKNLSSLNTKDPHVRDTISMGRNQWMVTRFVSNNPGVWMFHCHVENHLMKGMGMAFIEAPEMLFTVFPPPGFPNCGNYIYNNTRPEEGCPTDQGCWRSYPMFYAPLCMLCLISVFAIAYAIYKCVPTCSGTPAQYNKLSKPEAKEGVQLDDLNEKIHNN